MTGAIRIQPGEWKLALIALAIALRVLIAPGFMPVFAADGITVSLCTAQGAVEVELPGKAPAQKAHDPCPWGALAAPPLTPEAPLLVAIPFTVATVAASLPAALRPHIGAPAPPPPATGPPATL